MAKKLTDLMLKNDENGKQIRCLLVEDFETGVIKKFRNRSEFNLIMAETDEMFITKIYEPTQTQRDELLKVIQENADIENNETVVSLSDAKVLFLMLQFTDIELDSQELEETRELLEAIIENPNPLFIAIRSELELFIIETIGMVLETSKVYKAMPQDLLEVTEQLLEAKGALEEKKKELKKKQKKAKTLKSQVEKVEAETIEMG